MPSNSEDNHNARLQHKRIWLVSGIFVLAVIVFSIAGFFVGMRLGHLRQWVENQYFGKIVEVYADSIVLMDQDDRARTIFIEQETVIREGRRIVGRDSLTAGSSVIVVWSLNKGGEIEAKVIRILNP
ncbi:MAG: hypothetical protein HYT37_01685 [Candidatus Sungbacteria bacterium]|nr:hypothetical protein [Candidatus Sungbacteria bacterium]